MLTTQPYLLPNIA